MNFKETKIKGKDKKKLFSNISYLVVLQVVNLVLPLLTMPYLVRVLGADRFGAVMFAQAFVMYFLILTDFGFNLSATRTIAINKDNPEKVSEIFNSVMIIKGVLFTISLIIGITVINYYGKFSEDKYLFLFSFGIVFGQSLFPVWFFQGIEKMKNITILNVVSKVIFTLGIFVVIKSPDDYLYVPILNSIGFIIAGIGALYIAINKYKVKLFIPKLTIIVRYFKESSHFFLSRVSVSIFTISNSFVLGLTSSNEAVAYYSVAEKLYSAMQSAYYPITQGLYPYVANKKDIPLFKKIFTYATLFNTLSIVVMFILAPYVIRFLFGENMEMSIVVFRILLIALLINIPSMLLGYPFTGALGKLFIANYSVVFGAILHITLIILTYLFFNITVISVALLVVFTELFVFSFRISGSIKYRLWKIIPIK